MNQNNNRNDNTPYGQQENAYGQQNGAYGQQENAYGQQNGAYGSQENAYGQQNSAYGQQTDPYNHNPYQPQPGSFGALTVRVYDPYEKKKKTFSKVVIGLVCAAAAVLVIGGGAIAYFRSTPSYKVGKGLQNLVRDFTQIKNPLTDKLGVDELAQMLREDGGHIEASLDCSADVVSEDITLGVDVDFYKDMRNKELSADTSFSVMNVDLAHLDLYANDEVFCFSLPELYMENMYIRNENVVSQYNASIFGQLYPLDIEDFTIDLFADDGGSLSFKDWKNLSSSLGSLEKRIEACKEAMTLEKSGKGVYRAVFPAKECDRLLKCLVDNIYSEGEGPDDLYDYDQLITSDVSFLFEIDGRNHIESILLEEPVEMLDGEASMAGEIFFLGEENSIDKIQGKLEVTGLDGRTRKVLCQVQQSSDSEHYQMDIDLKWVEEEETFWKMKWIVDNDAAADEFEITCTMEDGIDDMELLVSGSFDDIVSGERMDLDLDNITYSMNGQDYIKITGDVSVEPLSGSVRSKVDADTAFFEMTEEDLLYILYQLNEDTGILGYLLDGDYWW